MSEELKQYVCFIKRRTGAKFIPYTLETGGIVVKTLREFLDHELARWRGPQLFEKATLQDFVRDVEAGTVNAKYAAMLGWNYSAAAQLVEEEGEVYLLIVHPRFEAKFFSVRRVNEDDAYALQLVEQLLSLRGGSIVFQEYDPTIHFDGCELKQ